MTGSPQTLRPATAEEIAYIRTLNAASWAGDLDVKTYHDRERVLASTPLTRNGGISSWVLVDPAADPHDILSSCETIKKRAFVSLPPPHPADVGPAGGDGPGDGDDTTCLVSLVMAHGVGNVFTPPQHRGNGYAKTMLRLLAEALKRGSPESFSVLYSDIGKKFYSRLGWMGHRSSQVEIPALSTPLAATMGAVAGVKYLGAIDAPSLCVKDISALQDSLVRPAPNLKPRVAFVPDYQTMEWHWAREEFMTPVLRRHLAAAGIRPDIKGAMTADGKRWVIWNRDFVRRGSQQLFIVRAVNLSRSPDEDAEVAQLAHLLLAARAEAAVWGLARVVLWNPDDLWLRAARRAAPPPAAVRLVDRDTDSICSLMMHGPAAGGSSLDHVDWVANEKFAWC